MKPHRDPSVIVCPHCQTSNPVTAYCCLNCFKVIRETKKVPFWQTNISPSAAFLVAGFIVVGTLIYWFRLWVQSVDAEVNMHFTAADYSLSLAANKKRVERDYKILKVFNGKKKPAEAAPAAPPAETPEP